MTNNEDLKKLIEMILIDVHQNLRYNNKTYKQMAEHIKYLIERGFEINVNEENNPL